MDARQATNRGIVVERNGMTALAVQALEFRDRFGHVPYRQQPARDETARISTTPFVNVPVVVGPKMRQRERLIFGRAEQPPVDSGESWENSMKQRCR